MRLLYAASDSFEWMRWEIACVTWYCPGCVPSERDDFCACATGRVTPGNNPLGKFRGKWVGKREGEASPVPELCAGDPPGRTRILSGQHRFFSAGRSRRSDLGFSECGAQLWPAGRSFLG